MSSTLTAETQTRDIAGTVSALEKAITESGDRLVDLVDSSPVLLVFLRHSGCTFCREAVSDIARVREEIEGTGTRIILVHMGDGERMADLIALHGLYGIDRIRDEKQELYKAFGLRRGSIRQLFGLKVWVRGLTAGLRDGHGWAPPSADSTQMPGVFLIEGGLIAKAYRHRSAADRPSYTDVCGLPENGRPEKS